MEINRAKERMCPACSKIKDKTKFYPNPNKAGEYLPYCRECTSFKFRAAEENLNSKWAALWCVCMEMGVPLFKDKFEAIRNQYESYSGVGRRPEPFSMYLAMLKDAGVKYKGIFESDMQLSDFVDLNIGDNDGEISQKDLDAQRKEWDRVWGSSYNNEQCERLDNYYAAYTDSLEQMDAGRMLRYRDLCKAELRKFEGEDSKDVTDEILKLMKLLKIDSFETQEKSDMDRFIDRLIWKIEETEPSEEEDESKYKDVAGFENSFTHIMRCMQNLLTGTKNYPKIPRAEE